MRNIKKLAITLCATLAFGAGAAGVATMKPFYANAETENAEVVTETVVVGNFSESNHGAWLWGGKGTVAHNTDPAYIHGNENGSLKVTPTATGERYLEFTPVTTDLTNYEKLTCYVYNPNDYEVKFDFAFAGGKVCAPKEWTELTINLDDHFDENNATTTLGSTGGPTVTITRDNITHLCFYNYGSGLQVDDSVYFSNLYAYNGECELSSFKMIEGASVRTDAPAGLRFATEISAEELAKLPDNAEFGTVIYPTAGLTDTTIPELYEANDEGLVYIKKNVWASTGDYASTDAFKRYYSVLIGEDIENGLPEYLWDKQLTAMSYVTYTNEAGITYITWADNTQSRSLVYVAAAAEAAGKGTDYFDTIFETVFDEVKLENYLTEMKVGEKQTLTTNAKDDMGTALPLIWETSDATIASVENGVVTAVGAGTVEITAKLGELEAIATINVSYEPITLVEFENNADMENIDMNWADAHALTYTDEVKFGEEKSSLRLTWTQQQGFNTIFVRPEVTDISAFDYITFQVYNPTNKIGAIGFRGTTLANSKGYEGFTVIQANSTVSVNLPISLIKQGIVWDSETGYSNVSNNADNVTVIGLVILGYNPAVGDSVLTFGAGDSIYISSIRAVYADDLTDAVTPTVAIDKALIAAFDQGKYVTGDGYTNTNLYLESYGYPLTYSYSTEKAYGTEEGSLKITTTQADRDYIVSLFRPLTVNISSYKYLVYRVYNPAGQKPLQVGLVYGGYAWCQPGGWTTITTELAHYDGTTRTTLYGTDSTAWNCNVNNGRIKNANAFALDNTFTNIVGMGIRLRPSAGTYVKESTATVYISAMYATNVAPTTTFEAD